MWNFSAPTRTSDVMARWRLTVVFALWALSMTLTAGKAQGQNCPATAGSMSLASVEEKRCVQAAGVTECSIVCRYGTSPTVKVRADWITKAPPGTDPRKGCTSKEHGWQNSWTRQIEAKWLFSTGANGDAATRDVIAALEPYALSCPAPKARTTVGAGTRGGRPIPRGKIKHATGTCL
jgi:hypothetical protein